MTVPPRSPMSPGATSADVAAALAVPIGRMVTDVQYRAACISLAQAMEAERWA